jgi:hypothetical protein
MANDGGPVVKIEMLEPLELKVTWVDLDVGVD